MGTIRFDKFFFGAAGWIERFLDTIFVPVLFLETVFGFDALVFLGFEAVFFFTAVRFDFTDEAVFFLTAIDFRVDFFTARLPDVFFFVEAFFAAVGLFFIAVFFFDDLEFSTVFFADFLPVFFTVTFLAVVFFDGAERLRAVFFGAAFVLAEGVLFAVFFAAFFGGILPKKIR